MKQLGKIFLIVLVIASFSQVSSDLYTPSMPAIVKAFSTSSAMVQRSLSLFLLGFALAQCIYGPVSDSFGRRRPMLVGLVLGLLGSLVCFFSTTIAAFLLGRCLQGVGSGCGLVLGRSILRDCFKDKTFARYISYLSVGTISIMASAPVLGGYLQALFGWRGCFGYLSLYGALLLIFVVWKLPETLDDKHARQLSWNQVGCNLKELSSSARFLGYCSILFAIYGGMLSWLAVGPLYLQHVRHLSPTTFGWIAFIVGGSSAIGAFINARLVAHFEPSAVLKGALCFMVCCSIVFLLAELMGQTALVWIVILLVGYVGPTILVFANTLTKALSSFGHIAGIGFAVVGFVQIIGGASVSALLSLFSAQTLVPLAVCFVLTSSLSLFAAILID